MATDQVERCPGCGGWTWKLPSRGCPTCRILRRARASANLRARDSHRLAMYYPPEATDPTCGLPSFGASQKRHERAGELCRDCRKGAAEEQRTRARRKAIA